MRRHERGIAEMEPPAAGGALRGFEAACFELGAAFLRLAPTAQTIADEHFPGHASSVRRALPTGSWNPQVVSRLSPECHRLDPASNSASKGSGSTWSRRGSVHPGLISASTFTSRLGRAPRRRSHERRSCHYEPDRLELAIRHGFCIVRWSPKDAAALEAIEG